MRRVYQQAAPQAGSVIRLSERMQNFVFRRGVRRDAKPEGYGGDGQNSS
jgi:hypothetical protein